MKAAYSRRYDILINQRDLNASETVAVFIQSTTKTRFGEPLQCFSRIDLFKKSLLFRKSGIWNTQRALQRR